MNTGHAILSGLKVLDLSCITAGARSTQLLADFGADVVKVESETRPDPFRSWPVVTGTAGLGDLGNPAFRAANRGKRALAVDLKSEQGREVCRRFVEWADVVVENFRYGVLDRLRLNYPVLREWNRQVVLLSLSSQGSNGPEREYISFGVTLEALGGYMALSGYGENSPVWTTPKVNFPDQIACLLAPGLAAWSVQRARETGEGMCVDISQRELVSALLGEYIVEASHTHQDRTRQGNRSLESVDVVCRCAGDDEWVAVSIRDDEEWRALCGVLGRHELASDPSLATPPARSANDGQITSLVEEWTSNRAADAAMWTLQSAGVPATAVLRARDLLTRRCERGDEEFHLSVPRPDGGSELQFGYPFQLSPGEGTPPRSAPSVGEHTVEVMQELGFDDTTIDQLLADRVIHQPGRDGNA